MALFGTLNGILGAGGAAPSRWFATANGEQRFSADFGATWSADQNIINGKSAVHGMPSGTWIMTESDVSGRGLYQSTDNGDSFTFRNNFNSNEVKGLSADNSKNWVAVGEKSTIKYSTDDGVTWNNANNPFTPIATVRIGRVTNNGSSDYICVGDIYNPGGGNRSAVAVSTDSGVNWSDINTGFAIELLDISTDGSVWIAVGKSGTILRSVNTGTSWTSISNPFGSAIDDSIGSVSNFGGVWVAVGKDATLGSTEIAIIKSTDNGLTWGSFITNPATPNTTSGVFVDVDALGQFMIYYPQSGGSRVMTSTDSGVTWGSVVNTTNGSPSILDKTFSNNSGNT